MRKVLLLAAALVALVGCGPKKQTQTPSAEQFASYIKAYTGGIVADDAVIQLQLTEDITPLEDGTLPDPEKLIKISPSLKGHALWSTPSNLSFVPEEGALKVGTTYNVSFLLGEVVSGAPKTFDFAITVKGREEAVAEPESEVPQEGFHVVSCQLEGDHIGLTFSEAPVNANKKGLVELTGVTRSYIQAEGEKVNVFFEGRNADMQLTLGAALKNAEGETLGQEWTRVFPLQEENPAVELLVNGNILPDKNQLILPFRAVNLNSVEVRIIKIYEKNVLMFLQDNDLDSSNSLRRSGRLVYKGDIPLDASKNLHKWNEHSIDLGGLLKKEPGAIYRIRLSFRLDQSLYGGREALLRPSAANGKPSAEDEAIWDEPSSYYWDNDYDWDTYNWEEANDPSKPSYYMDSDRFPSVQLMASDLGLMAEYAGGKQIWVTATDLISAKPTPGADIEVFDFQLQSIAKGKTDKDGMVTLDLSHKPFAIVAKAGGSTAYLKVVSGNERALSRFDVGGETLQQGIKAFLYGERGVWRPGDTVHLTMILSDKGHSLPEGHPATLEVYTPEGQFYSRLVRKGTDGFYSFDIPTRDSDPTGYWNAYVKVGGSSFHKTLHIETIKPNRFKVNTEYPSVLEAGKTVTFPVSASWLTGGAASGSPARADMTLWKTTDSPFKGFEEYSFNNPSSNFSKAEYQLYKTTLDSYGKGSARVVLPDAEEAPGMLRAFIVTSVAEPGGDESFTTETIPFSPFSAYVGIRLPKDDFLETGKEHSLRVAVVSPQGKRLKGHQVEYRVFKTGWNWWWDNPGSDLDAYVSGNSVKTILSGTFTSGSEDNSISFKVSDEEWGRYLILVRDKESGHVSGRLFTADWGDYEGRANRQDPESLTMLRLSTDKPKYKAGETATVFIPAAKGGQALVSLENATGVIRREWVNTGEKDTPWRFTVEPSMAPNIYVHVTLLQPYGNTVNDLPLRLYGVQRVLVENPDSHLEPVLSLPQIIRPEEEFTVKVSEKNGRPMTYTLAIVDEGLLDLTAFKTPDPWAKMYRSEALGVNTWDLYDQVIGAFSGRFSPLAAIGGDEDAVRSARKDNRFNPVVLTLAPKTLQKGSDVLKLKLPMYVGSVRVMLVAGHDGAFGNAEKTVPVQNPLMLVTTLPRVLGSGEEVAVPVNVFAMEDDVNEAEVSIQAEGPVTFSGPTAQKVKFAAKGDQLIHFAMKAQDAEGTARIKVSASAKGHKASESISLDIQNPHAEITLTDNFTLSPGASLQLKPGMLQLSGFPALDARSLYIQMRDYPYNCGEQLSARGLALLHLMPLLSEADAAEAKDLLPGIVKQLYGRQLADGGFTYWSGPQSNTWVSSMAGLFLTEAAAAGVDVNKGVLKAWKAYQQKLSKNFRVAAGDGFAQQDEAFRLYTLAVAGASSQPGMNRLRESDKLSTQARWILASAYAVSGKKSLAEGLLNDAGRDFPEYEPYNITYGTALRDRYMALQALVLTGRITEALSLATETLPGRYLSTQEAAFAAIAYGTLYDKVPTQGIKADVDGETLSSAKSSLIAPVKGSVKNLSEGTLYGTLCRVSREPMKARGNGLKVEVTYTGENGAVVTPASLKQGTRFTATVKATSLLAGKDLEQLALSLRIPSGWEILNDRMTGGADGSEGYDHKDIRDDRVNWFFALPAGRYKTFTVGLRAAYEGSYVMPAVVCEAMYEPALNASTEAGTAVVIR